MVHQAHRVVASTEQLRHMLASRYPDEPHGKFSAIPNGYDEADFATVRCSRRHDPEQELTIVHAGSINPEFRDPRPLFTAAREAAEAGQVDLSRIRFRFLGGGSFGESAEMRTALETTGLAERVEFRPRLRYEEALACCQTSLAMAERHRDELRAGGARYVMAQCQEEQGHLREAAELLERVVAMDRKYRLPKLEENTLRLQVLRQRLAGVSGESRKSGTGSFA